MLLGNLQCSVGSLCKNSILAYTGYLKRFIQTSQKPHIDFKKWENNPKDIEENIINRGLQHLSVDSVLKNYNLHRTLTTKINTLRQEQNSANLRFSERNAMSDAAGLKAQLHSLEAEIRDVETKLYGEAMNFPNDTHPNVPLGAESNARIVEKLGQCPSFSFQPRTQADLCSLWSKQNIPWCDFDKATDITGPRFYYLMNDLALLELAIMQLAIQRALSHGFVPMTTPDMVKETVISSCGYHPRSAAGQVYAVERHRSTDVPLALVGTAEIPIAGYHMDEIIPIESLPRYYVGFGKCFRREVGGAGQYSKGLYRVHQFTKVELFAFTEGNIQASEEALHKIINVEKEIFELLELHFRVLEMPTAELGLSAYHKFDIEAWMPGRGEYGEISSASNCTDFQSRRLNIRYKTPGFPKSCYVHTINGTASAIPRTIMALLETHQQEDGRVYIPTALRPFLSSGKSIIP